MTRHLLPWALMSMAISLAGCATTAVHPKAHAPQAALAGLSSARQQKNDLLYHVILGDIAGQQGHLGIAAEAFGRAAQESGDEGLTRRSTLLSLYARRYRQAHRLARLWLTMDPHSIGALDALADADLGLGKVVLAEQEFEQSMEQVTLRHGSAGRAFAFEHIAAKLMRHKRPEGVLTVMRALSARYPKDPVGDYALADLAQHAGHQRTALQAVDRALALKPRWEDAAVLKARILWHDTPRQALTFQAAFLRSNPDATRMRLDYARRLVSLQYWRRALTQFQLISKAAPNDPQVLYAAGLLALRTDKLPLAHHYLKQSLALAPGNPHTELYLGEIAEKEHRFARALAYYDAVIPPYRFEAQLRAALMRLAQSHPHAALKSLARLHARGPSEIAGLALARNAAFVTLHDYQKGLAVLNAVKGQTPHLGMVLYARALDEEKLGQIATAERDLERLVAAHPNSPVALNALGYTYIKQGHHKKRALILIRRALGFAPKDPDILDSLGWAYYRLGHPQKAILYLHRAFALSNRPTIGAHLGRALWAAGRHRAAFTVWQDTARKWPHDAAIQALLLRHKAP